MKKYLISFSQMEWQEPAPGIRFKAYIDGERKVRLLEFSEQLVAEEWCRIEHVGYVLEGHLSINFNGNIVSFRAGDGLFIPEGEEHKHKPFVAKGEKALLIMFEKA